MRNRRSRNSSSIPGSGETFLYSTFFRTAVKSIKPPVPWVQKYIPRGLIERGKKLTKHSSPVQRSRMLAVPPLSHAVKVGFTLFTGHEGP
jgi:hypothetical protein